jgi:hypothetical protein
MENPNKDALQEQVGLSMQASQQMNGSRLGNEGNPGGSNLINLNAPVTNQNTTIISNTKVEAPPPNILFSLMNGNQQQVNQSLGNNPNTVNINLLRFYNLNKYLEFFFF